MKNEGSGNLLNLYTQNGGIMFLCSDSLPLVFAMEAPSYYRRSLSCLIRMDQMDFVGSGSNGSFSSLLI